MFSCKNSLGLTHFSFCNTFYLLPIMAPVMHQNVPVIMVFTPLDLVKY